MFDRLTRLTLIHGRAMLHDPVKYPDPESFRPERFLTPSGEFRDDPDIAVAFGFGRRRVPCPRFVTHAALTQKDTQECVRDAIL